MYHIDPQCTRGARNTVAFLTCIILTVLPLQTRKRLTYTPSPRVARSNMTSQNPRAKRCRLVSPRCLTFCSNKPECNTSGERLHTVCPHAVRPCSASRMPASEAVRDPHRWDAGFCRCLTKTFESTASPHSSLTPTYSFHSSRPSFRISACSTHQNLDGALPSSAARAAATAALPINFWSWPTEEISMAPAW